MLVNDPELAVKILNDRLLTKGPKQSVFKTLFRRGMGSLPDGAEWAAHRSLVRPFFQSGALRAEGERILQVVRARISEERGRNDINLSALTRETAFGVLYSVIFRGDLGDAAFRRTLAALSDLNRAFVFAELDVYLANSLPLGLGRLLPGRNVKRCTVLCDEVRAVAREFAAAGGARDVKPLLSTMAASPAYDPNSLADELLTLFFAGYDTTSIVMQRTLLLLAKHPEELAQLVALLRQHYDPRDCLESLSREPLASALEAVIKESMRVQPPVAIHVRCAAAAESAGYALDKHVVPNGVDMFVNVPAVHLNTAIWGKDAAAFRPGRWLEAGSAALQKFWIPFGGGVRVCIGSALSLLELRVFLAEFLTAFPAFAAAGEYESVHGITNGFATDVLLRV